MDSPTLPPTSRSPPCALNDLPANVVDEILSRLPARDLVRTSVLSRSWRHRWHSVSDLNLDFGRRYYCSRAIDHILLLHSSSIRSFSSHKETSSSDADRWLLVLSRRLPHSLRLLDLNLGLDGGFPLLHSAVFSFRGLRSLSLARCTIPLPPDSSSAAGGFPLLRILRLRHLDFLNDSHLPVLLSQCPALEELSLADIEPCRRLCVRNPNLRRFSFAECHFHDITLAGSQTLQVMTVGHSDTAIHLAHLFQDAVCNGKLALLNYSLSVHNTIT